MSKYAAGASGIVTVSRPAEAFELLVAPALVVPCRAMLIAAIGALLRAFVGAASWLQHARAAVRFAAVPKTLRLASEKRTATFTFSGPPADERPAV